ncbi:hypothetical protein [Proteus hauseri]|uniref:hypothetical protein n=1 Tax=Proteus hauseri TaxID=183417 RepID=UPI0032DBBC6C
MKKNLSIVACFAVLLSTSALADGNKLVGSGTITFTGNIVDGNCHVDSIGNTFNTSCWNGNEMETTSYNLIPHEKFNSKIAANKGSMNINWINDNAAIMDVIYY